MQGKAKIIINSFLITFILISFLGLSFIAFYNTSRVVYGNDTKVFSIENNDDKYSLKVLDKEYNVNLEFIENPLQVINEIPFIIPNSIFYLFNVYEVISYILTGY